MAKPTSAPLIDVGSDSSPRLAVRLKRPTKATNGQEFLSGQVAGFTVPSALSMVIAGVGVPFVTESNEASWREALDSIEESVASGVARLADVAELVDAMKARAPEPTIPESTEPVQTSALTPISAGEDVDPEQAPAVVAETAPASEPAKPTKRGNKTPR